MKKILAHKTIIAFLIIVLLFFVMSVFKTIMSSTNAKYTNNVVFNHTTRSTPFYFEIDNPVEEINYYKLQNVSIDVFNGLDSTHFTNKTINYTISCSSNVGTCKVDNIANVTNATFNGTAYEGRTHNIVVSASNTAGHINLTVNVTSSSPYNKTLTKEFILNTDDSINTVSATLTYSSATVCEYDISNNTDRNKDIGITIAPPIIRFDDESLFMDTIKSYTYSSDYLNYVVSEIPKFTTKKLRLFKYSAGSCPILTPVSSDAKSNNFTHTNQNVNINITSSNILGASVGDSMYNQNITLNTTLNTTSNIVCMYDIVWDYKSDSNIYYDSGYVDNSKELSIAIKKNNQTVLSEVGLHKFGLPKGDKIVLYKGSSVSNATSINDIYDISIKVYKLNSSPTNVSGKNIKANIHLDNIVCDNIPTSLNFDTDSWYKIRAAVASNPSLLTVGATKTISVKGENKTIRVANNSSPTDCNIEGFSQGACGVVFEYTGADDFGPMNEISSNTGGWGKATLRYVLNNDYFNSLPNELKRYIAPTYLVSEHGSMDTDNIVTIDNIFISSVKEVLNGISTAMMPGQTSVSSPSRQLDYYASQGVTSSSSSIALMKSGGTNWWLRSATASANYYYINVFVHSNAVATSSYRSSPVFKIG